MFSPVSARSANAYQRVGVETEITQADPHRLVMMLFDGLSSNIVAARGRWHGVTSKPNASM